MTEDRIENEVDDLKMAMLTLFENGWNQEDADRVQYHIQRIESVSKAMRPASAQ